MRSNTTHRLFRVASFAFGYGCLLFAMSACGSGKCPSGTIMDDVKHTCSLPLKCPAGTVPDNETRVCIAHDQPLQSEDGAGAGAAAGSKALVGRGPAAGGDSAGVSGAMSKPVCGNSVIEAGEVCDPVSACPTPASCKTTNACLVATVSGDANACTAKCDMVQIAACKNGDGCCPSGCTASSDDDCSKSCGDGQVSAGETCEPTSPSQPCPTSCDDHQACTMDVLTGSSAQCNVVCTHIPIASPINGDGCCPANAGASTQNDNDCAVVCGNGVMEAGELCDGSTCPTKCDDSDVCTIDKLTGSAATCDAVCSHMPSTSATCLCGNGRIDAGESCDGNCQASCDDGDTCTNDVMNGSVATCTAACSHTNKTPGTIDSCCPTGADNQSDPDCPMTKCNGTTFLSASDLVNYRSCTEINGTLRFETKGVSAIKASDFPQLRVITGRLEISPRDGASAILDFNLPSLEQIGGLKMVRTNDAEGITHLHLPNVTTVGTDGLFVSLTSIRTLELPNLATIQGNVELAGIPLCTISMQRVNDTRGTITLMNLITVPYSTWRPLLNSARSTVMITSAGCCTSDASGCSTSVDWPNARDCQFCK